MLFPLKNTFGYLFHNILNFNLRIRSLKILLIFSLSPLVYNAQDSFIIIEAQFDSYCLEDQSQFYITDENGNNVLNYVATQQNDYFIDTIPTISGSHNVILTDNYGDGWYSNVNGFLRISNTCQDIIVEYSSNNNNTFYEEIIDFDISPCALYSSPISDFSVNVNYTCSGEVNFSDLSSLGTTSWFWDFGDGNSSTDQNPQHIYISSGFYDVQLISTNDYGSDTSFYENIIEVSLSSNGPIQNSCTPETQYPGSLNCGITFFQIGDYTNISSNSISGYQDFTCGNISLFAGEFYELSAIHNGNSLQNFSMWIDLNNNGVFDLPDEEIYSNIAADSSQSTIQIPSNSIFDTPLRLRIMSDNTFQGGLNPCSNPINGQAEDYTAVISINANPPISNFETNKNFTCDGEIQFIDLSTNLPFSWEWDFGDGNTSQMQNPTHNYTENGFYDVRLITLNSYGSDTVIKVEYIEVDNTNAIAPANCNPLTINHFDDYGIFKVEFANINNSSSDGEEGYIDFSCEHQAYVDPGGTYLLKVTTGDQNPHDTKAWIDYDNNNVFSSDELVMEKLNTYDPQVYVDIPLNLVNPKVRLRIMSDLVGNDNNPCDDVSVGQVEDYGIIIDLCALSNDDNITNIYDSFCQTYIFNNDTIYSPGIYYDTLSNLTGCDSIVILDLQNDTSSNFSVDYQFICQGDSITWIDGETYFSQNNQSSFNFINNNGCDSIVYLDLSISENFSLGFITSQTIGTPPFNVSFQNQTPNLSNYNFTWDFGDGTIISDNSSFVDHTFTSLGNWTVSLMAENLITGCEDQLTKNNYVVTLPSNDPCLNTSLLLNISYNNQDNCQSNNATVSVNVSGGSLPYSFLWSTGQSTSSISGLSTGMYTVVVEDSNNCSIIDSIFIEEFSIPVIEIDGQNPSGCGTFDGELSSYIYGGQVPYDITWNTGASTENIYNLDSGLYELSVIDANGCQVVEQYELISPLNPLVEVVGVNPSTCQDSNGIAIAHVSGGSGIYSFLWNNGGEDSLISGLSSGIYSVIVTDNLGCTATELININSSETPVLSISKENVTCYGLSNGQISVSANGGLQPYNYYWENGSTSSIQNGLSAGNYLVTLIDANNCQVSEQVSILSPNEIEIDFSVLNLECYDDMSGEIQAYVLGGTQPYFFSWSNGNETSNINELAAGNYVLTVTDSNNCLSFDSTTVLQPEQLSNNYTLINETCVMQGNGSINCEVFGGTPPYNYQWNNGENTASINNLYSGSYVFSVTDLNGCIYETSFLINNSNQVPETGSIIGQLDVEMMNQYQYTVSQSIGSTYYWSIDNGVIYSGQGTNVVTAQWIGLGNGELKVIEKDSFGCYGDTVELTVNVGSTNIIEQQNEGNIFLFPHPVDDILNIKIDNYSGLFETYLYDLNGLLLKYKYGNKLDLSGFSSGVYLVKIVFENHFRVFKLIKK